MRIVSLVPSWTETLLYCGLNVVGRTRYCIHPDEKITHITSVGGTKTPSLKKIRDLSPDLIVLDKEENTKETSDMLANYKLHVSHVRSLLDMPMELTRLARTVEDIPTSSRELFRLSDRWQHLIGHPPLSTELKDLPGVIQWIRKSGSPKTCLVYLIWCDPWMGVSQNTFIGSILTWLRIGTPLLASDEAYPVLSTDQLNTSETVILASSEPYPFLRKVEVFDGLAADIVVVDGEVYSWFGLRSLLALEHWLREENRAPDR